MMFRSKEPSRSSRAVAGAQGTDSTATALQSNGRSPSHEEIAARAYLLYEQSGYMEGHDAENWAQAEQQLIEETMTSDAQTEESQSGGGFWRRQGI